MDVVSLAQNYSALQSIINVLKALLEEKLCFT
jgi:hypothetical protein